MTSNPARDVLYQVWPELLTQQLLQAMVEALVFDQNFFASRGASMEFLTLPDGEALVRHIRMRDACGEASVTVACVLKAAYLGQCKLWLEVRRGPFTLDEPEHATELLALRELVNMSVPGFSPERVKQQFTDSGAFSDDLTGWAQCQLLGQELSEVLAP